MIGPDAVLSFWFAGATVPDADLTPHLARWFRTDPALDRAIVDRFGAALEQAGHGALDDWANDPRGRLALIVLMDQFSRNAFRGTPRAFALDREAAALCRAGLALGADRDLRPVERLFFYLPLLHAENRADQARSAACFARLAAQAPDSQRHHFVGWLHTARRCRWVIRWFGRYPHRNAVLSRRSTVVERCFLLAVRVGGRVLR